MIKIEDIQNPSFLSDLSIKELDELAGNIRTFLIENVSKTGGHLSSNLGAVELTIALHRVFESPKDKFIFDVGHQAYTHKILTGRANQFDTLRKYKGLSGYLKRSESEHDIFEAGHSSTSIAAAAGIEYSKKYIGNDHKVVPIIGDGALTGGMAFEALNFLGSDNTHDPVIILNDNEMSITENIGYLANILNDIRSKNTYRRFKSKTSRLLPRFLKKLTGKVERGIKGFLSTNTIFDDLGFSYYGPINGHDFKELIKYMKIAKKAKRPCVIHVLTEKGKGYKYSEKDQLGLWHGVGPFEIDTGEKLTANDPHMHSWSDVIGHYMTDYATNNSNFSIVIPAMIAGSGLLNFREQYPDRINDVGIAEQTAVTMSAGYAVSGVDVFTPIYSTFIQRAYDQVNHDVARQNLKVVFGIDRAGIVGADGETHQGVFDIPLLRHIPNITIAHPRTAIEAFELLNYAFKKQDGPFIIRYPRGSTICDFNNPVTKNYASLTWDTIHKGSKATFIAFGTILDDVRATALKEKLDIEIINAKIIKPLDHQMIDRVLTSNKPVIIYEESALLGGFGSSILEYAVANQLPTSNIHLMGIKDEFVQHGDKTSILKEYNLDVKSIIKTIKERI
jgi:1-deoxy-D-xylulose-5-phosphate synthase